MNEFEEKMKTTKNTIIDKDYVRASKLTEIIDFLTFGISNLSYISSPAIWFVVEMETQNLIVKATKNVIEIREQINSLLPRLNC